MSDPAIDTLWKNVLDRWDDDAAHAAFLNHCQESGQLSEAAVRYKGMTGDHERGESAQRRLRGVATLALAQLEATRTPRQESHAPLMVRLALIALFIAGIFALLRVLRS